MKIYFLDLGSHKGEEIDIIINDKRYNENDWNFYCVEANPKLYDELIKKYKNRKNVYCYNYAISDNNDVQKLYLGQHSTGSSLFNDKINVTKKNVEVQGIKASDLLKNISGFSDPSSIKILKSNIEGAEYFLIKDFEDNNLFKEFDLFLWSGDRGWVKDFYKIPSLKNKKLDEINKIISKNKKYITNYIFCYNDNRSIDIYKEVNKIAKEKKV